MEMNHYLMDSVHVLHGDDYDDDYDDDNFEGDE